MASGEDRRPLISVVLPTYDRPEMLCEAVRTVREQTYPNVELIVIDDCSPQPATEILDRVDTGPTLSLHVERHEKNRGANHARNTGLSVAGGEFIAFLDDDDLWHREKLKRQLRAFQKASRDVGLVYTGQRYVNETGQITEVRLPTTSGDATEPILRGAALGSFSTLMIRALVIEDVGLLDERLPSWQDRDFIIRVSREYEFKPVTEPLVTRRMGSHYQIADDYEAKKEDTYPLFVDKHRPLAAEYGEGTERRFMAQTTQNLAGAALKNGYYRDAVKYAVRIIKYEPWSFTGYLYLLLGSGGDVTYKSAQHLKRAYVRVTNLDHS